MVVQPAINPKKASVSGHFANKKRATIGRGVGTLDDFDDNFSYDLLDQEIAQCIEAESLGSSHSSPTAQYQQYSGGANSQSVAQLSGLSDALSIDADSGVTINGSSTTINSLQGNAANAAPVGASNGLQGIVSSSATGTTNNVIHGCALTPFQFTATSSASQSTIVSSPWGEVDAGKSNGGILQTQSQLAQSSRNNTGFLAHKNNGLSQAAYLNEQFRNDQLKTTFNLHSNDVNALVLKANQVNNQLNQVRSLLLSQPQNPTLVAHSNRLQQDLESLQNQIYATQAATNSLTEDQQLILKLKQKHIQQSELQALLYQHQLQQQQQQQQQQSLLNGNVNLGPGILDVNRGLGLQNSSVSNILDMKRSSSGLTNSSYPKINSTLSNGLAMNSNSFTTSSSTTNTLAMNNHAMPHRCQMCLEPFNLNNRVPKILCCTHTYCLSCLMASTSPTGLIQCPGNCGVSTQLTEAGLAGLTTNQGYLNVQDSTGATASNGHVQPSEVCASCTGTLQDQPVSKCRQEGHTLVASDEAVRLMVAQLRPNVEKILVVLRQVMKMRANIKERVESTLQSLAKFTEELKTKLQHDSLEEDVLISTLNDLNALMLRMDTLTYPELLRTFQSVERCANNISYQHTQCYNSTVVNEAVEALMLRLHQESLPQVFKIGLRQNEMFRMEQSLQEHALSGNYANVLLQYMVADLLGSRVKQNKAFSAFGNCDATEIDNMPQEAHGSSSQSPSDAGIMSNGVLSSSGTPDMAAMNGHDVNVLRNSMEQVDITCLLQTTEAIEAENPSSADIHQYNDHSASLGLSNICHLANDAEDIEAVDLEKSLLEGSASIEPEESHGMHSSAPSPRRNHSVTPPIGAVVPLAAESPAGSSDKGSKPFSYLDAAKKPAKPQPEPQPKTDVYKLPAQVKQIKTPHCWMKVTVDGEPIGRIVFQLRPDKAPKMCENFLGLCTNKPGYGYKGTHFFKNGDGFLAGGDVENDDGTGGYSIFNCAKFEADLCPLKDEVGMIRFKGNGTSENGRGMVGSQFMVWCAEREFKKFSFSLVFGRVVDGMDVVKKAAAVNLSKHDVMIEDCGGVL
ncbi:uncharacterized protein LOC108672993 isoform X2 [Hyalella azteca]|nr:uncharacterized protein LOC108672993 isoform X2 [Hyalella azteca]